MSSNNKDKSHTVNVAFGTKFYTLTFPKKFENIKKDQIFNLKSGRYTEKDSTVPVPLIKARFEVKSNNTVVLCYDGLTSNIEFSITKDGGLVAGNIHSGMGGSYTADHDISSLNSTDINRGVLNMKIMNRFSLVTDSKCRSDFFGHLLNELHKWLVENNHKDEAACLLSFVTKSPIFGAVLFLQFVTPLRRVPKSYYISTKLLNEWITSKSADSVFGFSVKESDYKLCSNEIFKKASTLFENAKKNMSNVTSVHNIEVKEDANGLIPDYAEAHINNLNDCYSNLLDGLVGNRFSVLDDNKLQALHDSLCLFDLKSNYAHDNAVDFACLIYKSGIQNALDAQIVSIGRPDDGGYRLEFLRKLLRSNLIFPCQALVDGTSLDFVN